MGQDEVQLESVVSAKTTPIPDPIGLRPGMLLCAVNAATVSHQSRLSCPVGTVMASGVESLTAGSVQVYLRTVNVWTGVSDCFAVSLPCLSRVSSLYGSAAISSPDDIRGSAVQNEFAIATHFARRTIAAIAANWPSKVPLSVGECVVLAYCYQKRCVYRFACMIAFVNRCVWRV